MSNDLTIPTKNSITKSANDYAINRAKSFKVIAPPQNYPQYVATVKAYAAAGLPFEHIANAGDQLGDTIERGIIDAPIDKDWQGKIGEVAEDESKLLAWQSRGETISITHQLSSPDPVTGIEVIPVSQDLASAGSNTGQTLNVVEGISVFKEDTQSLPTASADNSQLENNPYLKAIPDFNKPV